MTQAPDIIKAYTPEEAQVLAQRWLSVFARDRRGAGAKSYLWEAMSADRNPLLVREAAIAAYAEQTGAEFVVLCNDRKRAVLVGERPETALWSDCYVFPPNLAWTMAFTHEDGWIGPLFARHRDHEALDLENQARLRKAREKDVAREKGWY